MPPNPLPHLTRWLAEMGYSETAGMEAEAISWREIDAWCARTAIDLSPWEGRVLRQLSSEYVAEGRRATDPNCPPPWRGPVLREEREIEEAELEDVLG